MVNLTTPVEVKGEDPETIGRVTSGGLEPGVLIPFEDSIGSRMSRLIASEGEIPESSWIVRFIANSFMFGVALQSVRVLPAPSVPVMALGGKKELFGVRYFPLMVR